MVVARILLGFFEIMHNNQVLIETIKKILQVFPEGIIIQSLDEKSQKLILEFVNDAAVKEIANYEDPLNKPVDDTTLCNIFISILLN